MVELKTSSVWVQEQMGGKEDFECRYLFLGLWLHREINGLGWFLEGHVRSKILIFIFRIEDISDICMLVGKRVE